MAKQLKLSEPLEKAFLAGLIWGYVTPESVNPNELSAVGRDVHRAVTDLLLQGQTPPFKLNAVLLVLTEAYGKNPENCRAYLESIKVSVPGAEGAETAVHKLRERHSLLMVMNTAAAQVQNGKFNPTEIMDVIANNAGSKPPVPLSEVVKDGLPPPPERLPLSLLPDFSRAIGGGLVGLTVVSGEPAVGKSRLAWQVALDVNSSLARPVVYYDLDNGMPTLMDRTSKIFSGDHARVLEATRRIYLRDTIRTLDSDLVFIPAPALVVVDIFQALPTPAEFERQGLGHWIHRLGALRRRGYHVLVVSEVPRSSYGTVNLAGFKGSGEIEYTADLAFQMVPVGNTGTAEVHIVKNRHGERKGHCATFKPNKGVLWEEVSLDQEPWPGLQSAGSSW